MDPLSALSLAGNIAQFVDLGFKVTRRLSDYYSNNVPRSMQTITTLLPLVLKSLDRIKHEAELDKLDTDSRCTLRSVVAGCTKLCHEIEDTIAKVSRTSGDSSSVKFRKALTSLKSDDKVAEIGRSLQAYVQVLILYRVVDSKEVPARSSVKDKYSNVVGKLVPSFVRRHDLVSKLDTALADVINFQERRPRIVVLHGLKGAGKTQLALDYCFEAHKTNQFQTVFWLAASSPVALRASLEGVAATIHKSIQGSQDAKIDFVKDFLGERWHPWLLVLDGYVSTEFAGVDLWSLLPQQGCGGILVTTTGSVHNGVQIRVTKKKNAEELKALQKSMVRAIRAKNFGEMRNCVENGVDINEKNSEGEHYSKYHMLEADHYIVQATIEGFVEGVKYLLEEGADPEPAEMKFSVMCMAAHRGNPQILQAVLDFEDARGICSPQRSYDQALEDAAFWGHPDCARMLMQRRKSQLGSCFYTPEVLWSRAAHHGRVGTLELLEEAGLRPKSEDIWFESMKQAIWGGSLNSAKYLINIEPEQRKAHAHRALCVACEHRKPDIVRLLLENGCDPNLPDSSGTVAMLAVIVWDDETVMRLLLDHGALPPATGNEGGACHIRQRGHVSKTAVMVLESMTPSMPHAREFLLRMIEKSLKDGGWPLALATVETAERLGHKEAVLGHIIEDSLTPLAQAIDRHGDLQFARFFLKQGSNLDVRKASNGDSVLHMAVRKGHAGITQLLLDKTGEQLLRAENAYGNTPLHLAASKNHTKILRLLIIYGADPESENKFGVTPRDMALEENNYALEELLLEREEWNTWSLAKKLQTVNMKS